MSEDIYHLGIKALVRDDAGRVLLLQVDPLVRKDAWDLPGGRMQKGASVEETLLREIAEETGVTDGVVVKNHVGMVLSPMRIQLDAGDVGLILSIYECTLPATASIVPADGHVAYDWLAPSEAAKRLANKYPPQFCELIARL